jgi:hypothetical protein
MLKNILKLDGAQQLSKNEQKSISGGLPTGCMSAGCVYLPYPSTAGVCPAGTVAQKCSKRVCCPTI